MIEIEPTTELDLRPLEQPDISDVNEAEEKAKETLRLADKTETPLLTVEDLHDEIADDEKSIGGLFKGAGYSGTWDKIGLTEQVRRMGLVDWLSRLPFSPTGAFYSADVLQAVNRLREDKYDVIPPKKEPEYAFRPPMFMGAPILPRVSKENDVKLVEGYFLKLEQEQARGKTFGAKVFEGATYLPAWMAEFLLTGGVAKLGNVTAKEVAAKTLHFHGIDLL